MKNIIIFFVIFLTSIALPAQKTKNENQRPFIIQPDLNKLDLDEQSKKIAQVFFEIFGLCDQINRNSKTPEDREKVLLEITRLLNSAVEIESDSKNKIYLSALAEDILKNDFGSSYSNWLNMENPKIDILYQTDKSKKLTVSVLSYDHKLTQKAGRYSSLIDKMKANTTRKYYSISSSTSFRYPFLIADLLQTTGTGRSVLTYPPIQKDGKQDQIKIIVLRNVARYFFKEILRPVAEKAFPSRLAKLVDFKSYFSNIIMHKIAHFLGPYFTKSKSEEPELIRKKLKDLFVCIEEIKADTVALSNTSLLIKEKILSKQKENRVYTTYITHLLAKVRQNKDLVEKDPYLVQINYLLKNQGLVFSLGNQELLINFDRLKREIRKLMDMVLRIEQSGNYPSAKQFIKNYSVIPQELKQILKKMESIPVEIKIKTTREKNQLS
jgi:hypothetical protein